MNIFAIKFFLSLSLVLLITSCSTLQLSCELFNNTDESLTIYQANGMGIQNILHVGPKELVYIRGWDMSDYRITHSHGEWKYKTTSPYSKYIRHEGFWMTGKRIWKAQIEQDGKIYVVAVKSNFPINDFSDQPEKFPIIPAQ
jgi:hypothetical protein